MAAHLKRGVHRALTVKEQQAQREAHEATAGLRELCFSTQHEGLWAGGGAAGEGDGSSRHMRITKADEGRMG